MPSQFPISSPYPFEKDKGIGFGSFIVDIPKYFYFILCFAFRVKLF
jgi:hypothetical protein